MVEPFYAGCGFMAAPQRLLHKCTAGNHNSADPFGLGSAIELLRLPKDPREVSSAKLIQ
jgi:hypothetical protein